MPPVRSMLFLSIQLNTFQYDFYVSSRWSSFLSCLFPCFHVPSSSFLINWAFIFLCLSGPFSVLLVSASEVNNPQYIFRHLLGSLYIYVRSTLYNSYQIYTSVKFTVFYVTFSVRLHLNIQPSL